MVPEPKLFKVPIHCVHLDFAAGDPTLSLCLTLSLSTYRLFSRYLMWMDRYPSDPAYNSHTASAETFHDKCVTAISTYRQCVRENNTRQCAYGNGNLWGKVVSTAQ